jgi:ABC-type phosphate transport system permease subunit
MVSAVLVALTPGQDLREASYSCGTTRLETIVRVVIPAAHSGIIAAIVLRTRVFKKLRGH